MRDRIFTEENACCYCGKKLARSKGCVCTGCKKKKLGLSDMCDDRDAEADQEKQIARGDCHEVTMRVTMQYTVTMPGSNHETDDLSDYIGEVQEHGEIVDWEEV